MLLGVGLGLGLWDWGLLDPDGEWGCAKERVLRSVEWVAFTSEAAFSNVASSIIILWISGTSIVPQCERFGRCGQLFAAWERVM